MEPIRSIPKNIAAGDPTHRYWGMYGFTKLHFQGVYFTGGFFAVIGTILLIEAGVGWAYFSDRVFQRMVLLSIACFVAAISISAFSIFSLLYFLGRHLMERADRPIGDSTVPSDVSSERK